MKFLWMIYGLFVKASEYFSIHRSIRILTMRCPSCTYDRFDFYKAPYFKCTAFGQHRLPEEPTVHWFEGIQTCPRCKHEWKVADSD